MPRPKGSKNKIESEEANIKIEEETGILEPIAVENEELKILQAIHKSMTDRAIRDIGQLEVLISKLQ